MTSEGYSFLCEDVFAKLLTKIRDSLTNHPCVTPRHRSPRPIPSTSLLTSFPPIILIPNQFSLLPQDQRSFPLEPATMKTSHQRQLAPVIHNASQFFIHSPTTDSSLVDFSLLPTPASPATCLAVTFSGNSVSGPRIQVQTDKIK